MEINKIKEVNIYINNEKADIYSQDKLNLRFNNTFADPTKIKTIQTEYSFSFTLPITPTNTKIFDFANIPSKRNKFNKRYPTTVSVDGLSIFNGELIVQSITADGFKCNLYINKLNTVEEIFGDSLLSDITGWNIEYHQDETINEWNSKENIAYPQDAFFPLVSYGMFQKMPQADETYTSKFLLDDYNRIYNENFYPSLNLLRTVEKCFEHKGYTVQGDIFDDPIMRKIYMSTSLGKEQDPMYNYGDPEMGKLEVEFTYDSWANVPERGGRGGTTYSQALSTTIDLETPKFIMNRVQDTANWTKNNVYDIWSAKEPFCTITNAETLNKNLWRENRIVAPADGYYKINLELDYALDTSKTFTANWYSVTGRDTTEITTTEFTPSIDFNNFFIEWQLVKNSEDGSNIQMIMPDFIDTAFSGLGTSSPTVITNAINKYSAYPHTPKGSSSISTDADPYSGGYLPQNGKMLSYDPRCNPNFVLGTSIAGPYRYTSVIKNGRSWDRTIAEVGESRAEVEPYLGVIIYPSTGTTSGSSDGTGSRRNYNDRKSEIASPEYGVNTLPSNGTSTVPTITHTTSSAHTIVKAIVHLKKNDMLQLKMVQRRWDNAADYTTEESTSGSIGRGEISTTTITDTDNQTDAVVHLTKGKVTFECFSPEDISITNSYMNYDNPSRFPTDLELGQFLSNEDKMSDFINNFIKEFNLSYSQNGKTITLNKQKVDFNTKYAIDLTDRVNEIEMEAIEYPSQMSVQYTINEDERGFYISAERNSTDEQIQSNQWKNYADRGYDIIKITEDEYASEEKVTTKTSYNWYEDFTVTMNDQNSTVSIPIIAKDEWMIDGLKDAEFMKEDGLSFNRRYWFPSTLTDTTLTLCNNENRQVKVMLTSNNIDGCELSYKEKGDTLLTNYFNIFYDADTNYIKFDAYLTSEEYIQIKNGANIIVDDDVYIVIELNGYDCSGNNKTEITAMKK